MHQVITNSLTYSYPGTEQPALNNVTVQIGAGEFIALIGANKSGKSTFCYALAGVVPHLYHGELKGDVLIAGTNNKQRSISEIALHVGLVLQRPESQMSGIRYTVFEEVAFGLENRGISREKMIEKVTTVLSLLGLESVANHSPFELSGGQQQRLALATVFALDPDIIILDEPTTFLDPQGAELVFESLSQMQQQGKTIVIAEQRLDLIAHYADRVLAFDNGNLVRDGRPQEVLTSSTMQKIQLDWTRYTQVADLARKRGLLQESQPLPASLGQTVKIFSN